METTINREAGVWKTLLPALLIAGVAFAMVIIAYGIDSAVPGVHDAFHDFRHVIGISCH